MIAINPLARQISGSNPPARPVRHVKTLAQFGLFEPRRLIPALKTARTKGSFLRHVVPFSLHHPLLSLPHLLSVSHLPAKNLYLGPTLSRHWGPYFPFPLPMSLVVSSFTCLQGIQLWLIIFPIFPQFSWLLWRAGSHCCSPEPPLDASCRQRGGITRELCWQERQTAGQKGSAKVLSDFRAKGGI